VALALGAGAGEDAFGVDLGGTAAGSRVAGMVSVGAGVVVVVVGGAVAGSQGGDGVGAGRPGGRQDRTSRSKGSIDLEPLTLT